MLGLFPKPGCRTVILKPQVSCFSDSHSNDGLTVLGIYQVLSGIGSGA